MTPPALRATSLFWEIAGRHSVEYLWILSFLGVQAGEDSGTLWHEDAIDAERRLLEVYRHGHFRPQAEIRKAEGDAGTAIVSLERHSKKRRAEVVARRARDGATADNGNSASVACLSNSPAVSNVRRPVSQGAFENRF